MWDSATGAAVLHDTPGAQPALEGTFTVDGVQYITEYDLLKQQMADYTLDWAEGVTGVPADTIAQVARSMQRVRLSSAMAWAVSINSPTTTSPAIYALIASLTGNYGKRGTGCGIYHYHTSCLRPSWAPGSCLRPESPRLAKKASTTL
ncbi:MAG: hypothetical protein ACLRX5_03730 [Slackia sp.]